MVNCGNTGAIPDCLEAQDSIWKLIYNVPRVGVIRYKYLNENWQEIAMLSDALDYRFINVPAQPGQSATNYYLVYQIAIISGGVLSGWSNEIVRQISLTGPIQGYKIYAFYASFGTQWQVPNGHWWFQFSGIPPVGYSSAQMNNLYPWWSNRQRDYSFLVETATGIVRVTTVQGAISGIRFVRFQRIDNQPEPNRCKFEVFDTSNNIVFTRTEAACPEVQKIPCKLYPEDERTINVDPRIISFGQFLKGLQINPIFTIEGQKGTKVEIVPYPLPNTPSRQTILELYSPKGCAIHPKVCWECKPCQKCPSNTCLKVLDRSRNKICCYGPNGKVIATVDPDCETADC
jgi:hypothetical protein